MRLSVTFPSAIIYTASPLVTEKTDCSGTRMAEVIFPLGSLNRAIIPGFYFSGCIQESDANSIEQGPRIDAGAYPFYDAVETSVDGRAERRGYFHA